MNLAERNKYRAHFRQLCCLGLGGQAIMPDVFRTLHPIIGLHSAVFQQYDESGRPHSFYCDVFRPGVLDRYLSEYSHLIKAFNPAPHTLLRKGRSTGHYRLMDKSFYSSDMYNLVCRPLDQHFMLEGTVRDNESGHGAIVVLCREKTDKEFSEKDERTLAALLPYLEYGLKERPQTGAYGDERTGLIIANAQGRIAHISPEAKEILFWAERQPLKPDIGVSGSTGVPSACIKELCGRLTGIFSDRRHPPPMVTTRSRHGHITFRAYWMDNLGAGTESLIGITVTQRKPLLLLIAQRLSELPLSPKQKEVCLLVSQGKSAREISDALNISRTTYKDHLNKIYQKLGIYSRNELLMLLR